MRKLKKLKHRLSPEAQVKRTAHIEARKTQIRIVRLPITFETRFNYASNPVDVLARFTLARRRM